MTDPKGKAEDVAKDNKKKDEPLEAEEPQRAVVAGNDIKYLTTLGIDPSILDTKTTEFAKWLDYFGWVPGKQMRSRNFDEMRIDVDRELSKAQAGGWLARFQEEDERVDAIKKGIDVAIAECDELDNLLTLYSVELSVSCCARVPVFWLLTHGRRSRMILLISRLKAKVSRSRLRTRSCSRRNWNRC